MAVEMFKPGQRRLESPAFSVNRHGHFWLNKSFTTELKGRKAKALQLGCDAKTRTGIMRPAGPKDSDIVTIHYGVREQDKNNATVNAGAFANWINLDLGRTRHFSVNWNEAAGYYEFEIPPEFITQTPAKKKAAKEK